MVAASARERLDDLGERLALAHERAGHVEPDLILSLGEPRRPRRRSGGAVGCVFEQLRVAAPGQQRALDPEAPVALLLGARERVDHVVGAPRRRRVGGREALPDEAPDRPHAARPQRRDLVELVVLVAEHGVERVLRGPAQVLVAGDVGLGPLGHPRLLPDRVGDPLLIRARALARLRQDEGLVAELVERRADVAGDHRLAAREPLAYQSHSHGGEGYAASISDVAFSTASGPVG